MNTDETNVTPKPPASGGGFEVLRQHGRVDYRMVTDDQEITAEIRHQIIEDLKAYRDDNPISGNKPLAWQRLAEMIGVPSSTLHEIRHDKYKGSSDAVLRKIDQFLADEREKRGRFEFRSHAQITMTGKVFGMIRTGIRHNWMPVIIGSPGTGKTAHARAFAADRGSVIIVRADEAHRDDRGITILLCNAIDGLRPIINKPHRKRLMEIKGWLRKHGSAVLVVDEAQKLTKAGLEMLRDIHDTSDTSGRRRVPIILFGDHRFKKLIERTRAGESTMIEEQLARRLMPVFDIDRECSLDEDGGLYTVEDIVKIVQNERAHVLTPRATSWLCDLANVSGYGRLGFALDVLKLAIEIGLPPGSAGSGKLPKPIDVDALQAALEMTFGRTVAIEIAGRAGGELLTKTA